MSALHSTLRAMVGPPPPSIDRFSSLFVRRHLDRKATWFRAGTTPTTVAFVEQGLLRMYYTTEDGRDVIKSFVSEAQFCGALDGLLLRAPSRLSIDALEDTTLWVAHHASIVALYDVDPYWERLGRVFAERLYLKKVRREAALLLDSPAERYATFLREHAALEPRLRDYHIASYLGITPETLSRIKRVRVSPT